MKTLPLNYTTHNNNTTLLFYHWKQQSVSRCVIVTLSYQFSTLTAFVGETSIMLIVFVIIWNFSILKTQGPQLLTMTSICLTPFLCVVVVILEFVPAVIINWIAIMSLTEKWEKFDQTDIGSSGSKDSRDLCSTTWVRLGYSDGRLC